MPNLRSFAADHLAVPLVIENLADLEKRLDQMQDPSFQAQGWPIGSGVVESGNNLVVEARLKGAGMHWARASVNPLLSLRNAVGNDRWAEAWQQRSAQIRWVGRVRHPVQAKRVVRPEPPAPLPVVEPVAEPTRSPQPSAIHPWWRMNDAAKARLAEAGARART